jgi:ATP-binding cassette subfamily F protein 3
MQARLRQMEATLAEPERRDENLQRYGRLLEAFEHAGGYSYELEVRMVLTGLGLDEVHIHRSLDQLSGGQRTRALLACLLLEKPNILVLDEPTNHLDLQAIEWLEGYLQAWPEALIVASHDRYFLDRVARKVWDLAFGQLEAYPGNYSQYIQLRAERQALRQAEWEEQQALIARTEAFVRRYKAGQRSREAKGRQTRLNRMQRLERPREARTMRLRLESDLRSGEMVLVTHDLVVGYDRPLVAVPDLELRRLERVALIGANGSGKTTLLKTVLGQMAPLSGEVRLGASLQIGYLAQTRQDLDPESTIVDEVSRAKDLALGEMRDFLARYLFTGDDVFKKVGALSGGEQCRVALAKLTLSQPNSLVLDEPTNQLDIASQEIMEDVLDSFLGTVLFVSHDRYVIDALATEIWAIEDGRLRVYQGNYQEYVAQRLKEGAALREEADRPRKVVQRPAARAVHQPERTVQDVEEDIAYMERMLRELEQGLAQANVDQDLDRARALGVEYDMIQTDLEQLMAEWVTLGEAGG